ncbi:MAG TPA: UPF0175 family protein [Thermoanaerobaculia bacterium]|nr:UPF0175 family protein [Thermoanaerobaculia bacterium]
MAEHPGSTKQAVIPYPAGMPQMLKLSDDEFKEELRFLAAAKLYELGRLSSGKGGSLGGNGASQVPP